jgi:hypothetical protein
MKVKDEMAVLHGMRLLDEKRLYVGEIDEIKVRDGVSDLHCTLKHHLISSHPWVYKMWETYRNRFLQPLIRSNQAIRHCASPPWQLLKFGSLGMRSFSQGAGARMLPGPCQ